MSVVPESQKWGRGKKKKKNVSFRASLYLRNGDAWQGRGIGTIYCLSLIFLLPRSSFHPPPPSLPAISRLRLVRIDLWWCEIALVHIVFLYIFIIGAINLMKGLMSACRWCAARIQMNLVCKEKRKFSHNFIKLQLCVCVRGRVCVSLFPHTCGCSYKRSSFFSQCVMFTGLRSAFKQARECFEEQQRPAGP